MDNFESLVRRVANMLLYGVSREEIRRTLLCEKIDEELIFFAYVGAKMLLPVS